VVDRGPHKEVRDTLHRAIWRLNLLEYVILFAVAGLSLVGGALIALFLGSMVGVPFRTTWAVSSILIFVIPAAVVWAREIRSRDTHAASEDKHQTGERNG